MDSRVVFIIMDGMYTSYEGIKDIFMANVLNYLIDGSVKSEFSLRGNYENLLNLEIAIMFLLEIFILLENVF